MMRRRVTPFLLFLCACAFGQTAPPAFDVASVKPAPPPADHRLSVRMSMDAGRVTLSNVTLKNVMTQAYKVKEGQISGPDWLNSERYDIVATFPAGTSKDQVAAMMQTLLKERFQVALHRETKVMPVYALVAAKNGEKLQASEKEDGLRVMMSPKGRQMTGSVTMERLSETLSGIMDRPVVDSTELKGPFDIDLAWTPDESQAGGKFAAEAKMRPGGAAEPDADGPTIFTALQDKLGLKLEAKKLPVEMLVIDQINKIPTAN